MSRLPGRGAAALLVTRDGTHYGLSSRLRGFSADVSGIGMVWFRPAGLQPIRVAGGISTPSSRVNVYGQCTLVSSNIDWWIADHLTTDRFDGATVTIYREAAGALGSVMFSGYVLAKRGVSANNQSVTFQCTDALGFFLANKTVGGKHTLNEDDFPALAPPEPILVTLNAIGGADPADITQLTIATNNGFGPITVPYAGPWPSTPAPLAGVANGGSVNFIVLGKNSGGSTIYAGAETGAVTNGIPPRLWVTLDSVETSEPETISNPDEGAAIPVVFGQYGGDESVPCLCYDWGVTNSNVFKFVYEDLSNVEGDAMKSRTAGNNDVWCIDTNPPQTDPDGNPIDNPRTFISYADSFAKGEVYKIRDNGNDIGAVEGALITWDAPGGPGNIYGTFSLNAAVFNYWWTRIFGTEDVTFDPSRFKLFTGCGGARTDNATVMAAVPGLDAKSVAGVIARLLVDHGGVPPAHLDLTSLEALNDLPMPRLRRYITSGESVATLYAAVCEEANVLSYVGANGKVAWRQMSLTAPPPAVFRFDERSTTVDSMQVTSSDWGPYFNAASGETEQGRPYDQSVGKITVPERQNDEAIALNDDVKESTTIQFAWIYEKSYMNDAIDNRLSTQGLPSDVYACTVHGTEPGATAIETDIDAQFSVVGGDTIEAGWIASRVDSGMSRLLPTGSLLLCIGFDHDPERDLSTLTLWRLGASATASQSVMLIMDGTETFPASLGGGAIGTTWNTGWTDAQKAYAANYGSGVGGWISDSDAAIHSGDASVYNTSLME